MAQSEKMVKDLYKVIKEEIKNLRRKISVSTLTRPSGTAILERVRCSRVCLPCTK